MLLTPSCNSTGRRMNALEILFLQIIFACSLTLFLKPPWQLKLNVMNDDMAFIQPVIKNDYSAYKHS